jgi:hypothetical protein
VLCGAGLGLSALGLVLSVAADLFGIDPAPVFIWLPVLAAGIACLAALPFAVARLSGHRRVVRRGAAGVLSAVVCAAVTAAVLDSLGSTDIDVVLGLGVAGLGGLFSVTLPARGVAGLAWRLLGVAAAVLLATRRVGVGDELVRAVAALAILVAVLGTVEWLLAARERG